MNISGYRLAALFLLMPAGFLLFVGVQTPFSPSGWAQLAAVILFAVGLLRPSGRRRRWLLVAGGVFLATIGIRIIAASSGRSTVTTLPGGHARWLGRLVDEQDMALSGAALLPWWWPLAGAEQSGGVGKAMYEEYVALRRSDGMTASPALNTILGQQTSNAFDAIVIEPLRQPKAAVVFLHGAMGSFTFECWLIAQSAREIDAVTVCPATDFTGLWDRADGQRILKETLDYLDGRGFHRVFLAGLSNGGVGAAHAAPRLADRLQGVIVISGSPGDGRPSGVPTLVIQGEQDPNMPAEDGRAYAARVHGTYAGFEGGHFVLLMQRRQIAPLVAGWLRAHLSDR